MLESKKNLACPSIFTIVIFESTPLFAWPRWLGFNSKLGRHSINSATERSNDMIRHIFVFCLIFLTASSQSINAENPAPCSSNNREIQQLRIYELDRSKSKDAFDAFHVRFRDQALRIMKRHGFKVLDIWVSNS